MIQVDKLFNAFLVELIHSLTEFERSLIQSPDTHGEIIHTVFEVVHSFSKRFCSIGEFDLTLF